ncbi:MAG: serine hydrolase [Deltaproteobacteria bacterium]|nr:serine hydrolase [Deltaproteobacteria bacterium]
MRFGTSWAVWLTLGATVAGLAAPCPAGAAAATAPAASGFAGTWKGEIATPGTPLGVEVLVGGDGKVTISIPVQHNKDMPTSDVQLSGDQGAFTIAGVPGSPRFVGTRAGEVWSGTFSQGGASFPFKLQRQDPEALTKAALAGIDAEVQRALKELATPGAAIAVVRGGKVVYAQGFGVRDREKNQPVTPATRFMIGSTTKAFTALLLGQLVDAGQCTWDTPVRQLLPDFAVADEYATNHLTVRDLLTHRTGVARSDLAWYGNAKLTRADLFAKLKHLPIANPMRQTWEYNNFMYAMAGFTLERLSGQTWEQNLQRRVLQPLGMAQTLLSIADLSASPDRALGYHRDGEAFVLDPYHNVPAMAPAGSTVASSVLDMGKWLAVHLGSGSAGGQKLVKASTAQELHRAQMAMGMPDPDPDITLVGYGLGWMADVYRGHRRVHHSGGIDGFTAEVSFYPLDDLGIVVLCNAGDTNFTGFVRNVYADRLLGLAPRDWIAKGKAGRAKGGDARKGSPAGFAARQVANTKPSRPLAAYVGTYLDAGFGAMEVTLLASGSLQLKLGGVQTSLRHQHFDSFVTEASAGALGEAAANLPAQFFLDFDGEVAALQVVLDAGGKPIRFERQPDARLSDPAFLAGLCGDYDFGGVRARVFATGSVLQADVTGQRNYTLKPGLGTQFSIEGVAGASVRFKLAEDGKTAREAVLVQPGVALLAARQAPKP